MPCLFPASSAPQGRAGAARRQTRATSATHSLPKRGANWQDHARMTHPCSREHRPTARGRHETAPQAQDHRHHGGGHRRIHPHHRRGRGRNALAAPCLSPGLRRPGGAGRRPRLQQRRRQRHVRISQRGRGDALRDRHPGILPHPQSLLSRPSADAFPHRDIDRRCRRARRRPAGRCRQHRRAAAGACRAGVHLRVPQRAGGRRQQDLGALARHGPSRGEEPPLPRARLQDRREAAGRRAGSTVEDGRPSPNGPTVGRLVGARRDPCRSRRRQPAVAEPIRGARSERGPTARHRFAGRWRERVRDRAVGRGRCGAPSPAVARTRRPLPEPIGNGRALPERASSGGAGRYRGGPPGLCRPRSPGDGDHRPGASPRVPHEGPGWPGWRA